MRPLVAEFGTFVAAVAPTQQTDAIESFVASLPKGSKITSRQLRGRGEMRVVKEDCKLLAGVENLKDDDMVELCWIGVPSSPSHFVERAHEAGHPRGLDVHVDEAMLEVVKLNMTEPPFVLAKKRVQFMKRWTERAKQLSADEEQLRAQMPEHVRQVAGRKRLVLMGEMLEDLGYPDDKLVSDIAAGFRLSGYMTKSNVFRAKSKRPPLSMETLKKLGRSFNTKNFASLDKRQETELEEATWKETQTELEKGWIFLDKGGETDNKFVGKRFGIRQGSKIRVIDDRHMLWPQLDRWAS